MPLTVHIHLRTATASDRTATVALTGSLDAATVPQLEQQLVPLLSGPATELVFDLAKLDFVSSAGLRVFATARKALRTRGGQASFVNLQPQIRKVFEIVSALPGIGVFQD